MHTVVRNIVIAFAVFMTPVAVVVASNWSEYQPYFIGDPSTAEGELLYFARRG